MSQLNISYNETAELQLPLRNNVFFNATNLLDDLLSKYNPMVRPSSKCIFFQVGFYYLCRSKIKF